MPAASDVVQTRQQMARLLDDRMTRTYGSLRSDQALERDSSLVKTYLVEAQLGEDASSDAAWDQVGRAFRIVLDHSEAGGELYRGQEPSIASIPLAYRGRHSVFYVDFTNPRFWRIHTMGLSQVADWVMDRLTRRISFMDRAWLPPDLLEAASALGSFRGLGLDYDRRPLDPESEAAVEEQVSFLKVQLWGNKARDVLELLRAEGAFPHQTTLAKVKVKYWLVSEDVEAFSLDDIKYDGKLTARGTSFQSHLELTSHIYEAYADEVRSIETRAISWSQEGDGIRLNGEPVEFRFTQPHADLSRFCEQLFRPGNPFRLWGVPVRVTDSYFRVAAFDLHVARPLTFEVRPTSIRLFLPTGSCGNSVLRFYTNLQHHFDSIVSAVTANGGRLFEF